MFQSDIFKEIDRESMISLMKNLLENAYKYSPIEKKINIDLQQKEGQIYLSVADNGVGIEKSERNKVFDQFYRIGSEDTRASKGTGLGLYIVNQIVNAHNGKIRILDNEGGGTKFEIIL